MRRQAGMAALFVLLGGMVCLADDDAPACAAAVKSARVTPMQAVEIALNAVGGGAVAYEMEVEVDEGVPVYKVVINKLGNRHSVHVGCETGEIVKQTSRGEVLFGLYKWDVMTISLAKAMETALGRVPGQVIDVDLVDAMGTPKFQVDIYTEGRVKEVEVNSSTGQITKIEDETD
jgi:uncharacterized membrane protein YkoI